MKITTPGWTQAQGVGCFFLARRTHSRALRSSLSHAVKSSKKKKEEEEKRSKQTTNQQQQQKKDKEKLLWAGYMNNGNFSTFFIIFFHLKEKARFTASEH